MSEDAIDVVAVVDSIVSGCVTAGLPLMPIIIAEAIADTLCKGTSRAEHSSAMVQLTEVVRERIEFLAATRRESVN